eukprot:scaffold1709_cov158-Ochromonas_danica.AAC.5
MKLTPPLPTFRLRNSLVGWFDRPDGHLATSVRRFACPTETECPCANRSGLGFGLFCSWLCRRQTRQGPIPRTPLLAGKPKTD